MTNREAVERGMTALEERSTINPNKGRTRAAARKVNPEIVTQAEADKDAEAWNMLRHLSRVL